MFCRFCGFKLSDDSSFCPNCGKKIIDTLEKQNNEAENNDEPIIENDEEVVEPILVETPENEIVHKKKKKSAGLKISILLLTFSSIGLLYALTYTISGFVVIIPALLSWVVWLVFVCIFTLFTLGLIWTSDGFKKFNSGWLDFNQKFWNGSTSFVDTLYKVFPYIAGFFGAITLAFLILTIIRTAKTKSGKGFMIAAIIMFIIFALLMILDIRAFLVYID